MDKATTRSRARELIIFEIPACASPSFLELSTNPQNISIQRSKLTNNIRTKGGFILQYWGPDLTKVSIKGDTGEYGIEAINVLEDIYNSEQLALQKFIENNGVDLKRRQSLAQMGSSVIMWYQNQGLRGILTSFSFEETAASGIFTYSLEFTVFEIIGKRKNFLPWHRKPWSTIDTPSTDSGMGYTTGGGYGTDWKIGELNTPENPLGGPEGEAAANLGLGLKDSEFERVTGESLTDNKSKAILRKNYQDNSLPIDLFPNKK